MTTSVDITRQTVLYAERAIDFEDFTSGTAKPLIYLRPGTQILGGFVDITTAWNSATSAAITIGDTEGVDDVDRYLGSTSIKATGRTALVPVSNGVIETAEALTATVTVVGAPTAGAGKVGIWYIESGSRSTEYNAYIG